MGVNYTKNSRKGEWRREYAIIHRNAKDEEEDCEGDCAVRAA